MPPVFLLASPADSDTIGPLRASNRRHVSPSGAVTRMKTKLFAILAWAVLALLGPAAALAQSLPVKTVEFPSEAVGRTMKYNVVLPAKYEQTTDRYPVLYLLHGYSSNYTAWARMG